MSDYDRAKSVLRLLRACEQSTASARAMAIQREVGTDQYRDAMASERAMQDWKLSIRWVLRAVGYVGSAVLVYRLTRQQHSQANSYISIGKELGISKAETELMFEVSLAIFIRELNARGISNNYWEIPESLDERCAADEVGEYCPLIASESDEAAA